jgi:hypothetical protein
METLKAPDNARGETGLAPLSRSSSLAAQTELAELQHKNQAAESQPTPTFSSYRTRMFVTAHASIIFRAPIRSTSVIAMFRQLRASFRLADDPGVDRFGQHKGSSRDQIRSH